MSETLEALGRINDKLKTRQTSEGFFIWIPEIRDYLDLNLSSSKSTLEKSLHVFLERNHIGVSHAY